LIDRDETSVDVESYNRGASPYGLLHMAGNVQEWTLSLWERVRKRAFLILTMQPTVEKIYQLKI